MACACKSRQRIHNIVKEYGDGEHKKVSINVLGTIEAVFVSALTVLLSPVLFTYILFEGLIFGKTLSINKLLNVGKQ